MAERRNVSGFTLIELMIVVAIIAILVSITLPAYQDYVARSQVTEGASLATGAKTAIAIYYGDYGHFPPDNEAAGMADPTSISGRYISSVTVGSANGLITVAFNGTASVKLHGQTLTMQVTDNQGSLRWQCGGVDNKYLPSSCR